MTDRLILRTGLRGPEASNDVRTALEFAQANPVLAAGRIGYAIDAKVLKVGDGVTPWNLLAEFRRRVEGQRMQSSISQTNITAAVDLTGLGVITFTVEDEPWTVHLSLPYVWCTTLGSTQTYSQVVITDENGVSKQERFTSFAAVNEVYSVDVFEYISAPGTYTRKGRFAKLGTGAVFATGFSDAKHMNFIEARPAAT